VFIDIHGDTHTTDGVTEQHSSSTHASQRSRLSKAHLLHVKVHWKFTLEVHTANRARNRPRQRERKGDEVHVTVHTPGNTPT
jgi:hypothetical protein